MGERWSRWKRRIGTTGVLLGVLGLSSLVWWNMCGQGPYADTCRFSIGCRSYLCLEHALRGDEQVAADGRCPKECDGDAACGSGFRCPVLGDGARGDLPPFGKPERACMRVLE